MSSVGRPGNRYDRFPMARRGYDQGRVDAFVAQLTQRVDETEAALEMAHRHAAEAAEQLRDVRERLEQAEAAPAPPAASFAELGEEVARVLQSASQAADAIRQRAEAGAEAAVAQARESAVQMVRAAQARVADLEQASHRDRAAAKEVFEKARRQAAEMARELRARAEAQAVSVVEEAEGQATAVLARAEREGEARVVRGTAEAERLVAGAEEAKRVTLESLTTARSVLESEIAGLEERRASVVAELDRLRSKLEEATSELAGVQAREPLEASPAALLPDVLVDPAPLEGEEPLPIAIEEPAEFEVTEPTEVEVAEPATVEIPVPQPAESGGGVTLDDRQEEEFRRIFGDLGDLPLPSPPEPEIAPVPVLTTEERGRAMEGLARKLKRALQDEQNLVLDAIRQAGDEIEPQKVIPAESDLLSRLSLALGPLLREVVEASGRPGFTVEDALSDQVSRPLHEQVEEVLTRSAAGGEGGAMTSDRVSAVFRAWRTDQANELANILLQQALTGLAPTASPA